MRILTTDSRADERFLRTPVAALDFVREDVKELRALVREMRRTMKAALGIGLSANQVGFAQRLFVAEIPSPEGGRAEFYACINPVVIKHSKEKEALEEGCLSIPRVFGEVERALHVTIEASALSGKRVKIRARGLLARVFQHEIDHLDGVLFTDKATHVYTVPKRERLKEK